ncbi:MAG: AhpC/TSA family protein [Bdellovibrionales bacterium]|nr:AhpC/TSA family protein [Bdellovibrionales bacterium]
MNISNKCIYFITLFLLGANAFAGDLSLTEQLKQKAEMSKAKSSPEKLKIMESAIEDLKKSNISKKALGVGSNAPNFTLPDVKRGMTNSAELLKSGSLVITFYRGGWCPYCNLQLHDLQKHLKEINALGANLVAISPQTPDASLSTVQKDELSFYVLSDVGNTVAKKFGLVYKLPDDLKKLYKEFGIDLEKANASHDWELPVSATYIVTPDNKIVFAHADPDYKKRAETKDILAKLKELKKLK